MTYILHSQNISKITNSHEKTIYQTGGATVFVAFGAKDNEYEYLSNLEEREEGGTQDIIGSIRAALLSLHFFVKL